jgi:hypothetical protein
MHYSVEEKGLISGLLGAYFSYPAVSEAIHAKYLAIHNRLLQEQLTAADYAAIENALLFLAPIYRSEQEDHRSIMSTIFKTSSILQSITIDKEFA